MPSRHVKYYNQLVRDMTRETIPHGKVLTPDDRNKVFRKCEEYLAETQPLFRDFMAARTEGEVEIPKKSGE